MNAPATKQKVSMDIMVLAQFYAYVFQGFFITILCGLLTHVIFINKSLWRSYKIIAWQTFVGTLMGASQMMAGIARLITFYIDQEQLRSKQYCVLMPWNLIAFWAEPMVAICLLMVSTDRLLAVVMPIVYYKKSANLQNIQIVMWNVTMLLITSVSWYYSLTDTNQMLSPFCWTSDAMFPVFNSLTLLVTIATSVSSVILYVIVFVLSRKRAVRPRDKQQFGGTFQQQQRRLTVTLALIGWCDRVANLNSCNTYGYPPIYIDTSDVNMSYAISISGHTNRRPATRWQICKMNSSHACQLFIALSSGLARDLAESAMRYYGKKFTHSSFLYKAQMNKNGNKCAFSEKEELK